MKSRLLSGVDLAKVFCRWLAVITLMMAACARVARAQQYITDDAALTELHACQLQMWHGERSSWLLPVCTPVKNIELSLGLLEVWHDGANGHLEYIAQAKTLFKPLAPNSWGAGLVMGYGRPLTSVDSTHAYSFYLYVPVSESLWHDRLILDENVGFFHGRHDVYGDNAFAWAVRSDGVLAGRSGHGLVAVLEIYGAERIYRDDAHTTTEYQAGLRTWVRPDRIQIDLTRGRTLWRPFATSGGAGWTLGLTLVTPPFL